MPVEAIHMSAFVDSQRAAALPGWLAQPALHELGRLGCILIDFPYFNRFPTGVARYLLKLPTAVSAVGEALHHGRPALVARSMLDHAQSLLSQDQAAGRRVLGLALGFVSHLAVDATIHPFVNRQAIARATRIGDSPLRQHSEVEKFHSVLFHEERNGFDFMGTAAFARHIGVDTRAIHRDPVLLSAFRAGLARALGDAPTASDIVAWARGYAQYTWLTSSPAGKILMPERVKHEVRDEVYAGPWGTFRAVYDEGVAASARAMEAGLAYVEHGDEPAFLRHVPQGAIDDLLPAAAAA